MMAKSYTEKQRERAASLNPKGGFLKGKSPEEAAAEAAEITAAAKPRSLGGSRPPESRFLRGERGIDRGPTRISDIPVLGEDVYSFRKKPKRKRRGKIPKGCHNGVTVTQDPNIKLALKRAHSSEYANYLKSEHWRAFRKLYYEDHPKRCNACDSQVEVHLHHKTYERIGREVEADVVPLCSTHHAAVHEYSQANRHLTLCAATEEWLKGYCESKIAVA